MLRKSLFAIAVLAFMVTTVQAGDTAENPIKFDEGWPGELVPAYWVYEEFELCQIPVYLKVGHFVELENCNKKKIVMEQVPCGDIGKPGQFPCYLGCTNIKVRANFEVKLGTILYKKGDVIEGGFFGDKWEAYYDGTDVIPAGGAWTTTTLCVKAWSADIFYADPGSETLVGEVAVTVKPNV